MSFLERVRAFDDAVDAAVAGRRNPTLDLVAFTLSSVADHSLLWQSAGLVREIVGPGDLGRAARFALAMGAESALTNGPIKAVFARSRPADFAELEFSSGLRRPITSSFPSGHAAAAFCAATLLGGGPGWYALAAAVASTRVYVRLHYASDVVGGAALGLALGAAFRPFVRRSFGTRGE